jgi:hypothetical protein
MLRVREAAKRTIAIVVPARRAADKTARALSSPDKVGARLTATQPLLPSKTTAGAHDRLDRFRPSPPPGNVPRRFSLLLDWRLETISSRAKRLRGKPRRRLSRRRGPSAWHHPGGDALAGSREQCVSYPVHLDPALMIREYLQTIREARSANQQLEREMVS